MTAENVKTEQTETQPLTLPQQKRKTAHRFEQAFHAHHRYCDCAMPMTQKKWNDALGTFIVIRLCCMARAVEALTGIELYQVFDFPARWVWDCTELHQSEGPEGTVEMVERGAPPDWLLARFREKGIEVRNLPEGK